jgi:hypothetical protein
MRVVLTAPMPGVNTPSFPFGGAMLTGLRIRCSPLRLEKRFLPGRRKMEPTPFTIKDDRLSEADLQGTFYMGYCLTMFYNINYAKS